MGRLDGKVCFVTGAGSGIGAKTAELFAHEGASVIMADMHEENLSKVAADIQAAGGEVMTAVVNITGVVRGCVSAVAAGVEKYGKLDALANIAGVLDVAMRPIDDFLTSDLDTTLTVNVKGTMYVTRAAVKQFIAQGYGTIATVASVGGLNGNGSLHGLEGRRGRADQAHRAALCQRRAEDPRQLRVPRHGHDPHDHARHEGQRQVHEGRQGHAGLHRKALDARRGHVHGSRHRQDPAVFVQRRFCAAQRSGARCRLRRKPLIRCAGARTPAQSCKTAHTK